MADKELRGVKEDPEDLYAEIDELNSILHERDVSVLTLVGGLVRLREELQQKDALLEEASSFLLSVKIQYEKRPDLTVVERELLAGIREWVARHPPPSGDA